MGITYAEIARAITENPARRLEREIALAIINKPTARTAAPLQAKHDKSHAARYLRHARRRISNRLERGWSPDDILKQELDRVSQYVDRASRAKDRLAIISGTVAKQNATANSANTSNALWGVGANPIDSQAACLLFKGIQLEEAANAH